MSNGVLFWQTTFGFCRPVRYFVEGMNFLSDVYEILPKSTRPPSFRHFPSPILGHSDNFLQILYWFDIHRQILSLLAQLMSASVKSCRIFSYQSTSETTYVESSCLVALPRNLEHKCWLIGKLILFSFFLFFFCYTLLYDFNLKLIHFF